jgi:hypothetical protein
MIGLLDGWIIGFEFNGTQKIQIYLDCGCNLPL